MSTPLVNDDELKPYNVVVDNVSKTYQIRPSVFSLRKSLSVEAVRGATVVARAGESVGVLGHNGSGKSTLLRMMAGGEAPTSGVVKTRSTPTLLGVGAALQRALPGDVNIRLGCLAMGLAPDELDDKVKEIAEFVDIGDALYRPMETYSSGQAARLRFGISTAIRPDILLIDEALSTGDASFTAKAQERMEKMLGNSGTVFLVSHGPTVIERLCHRVIWLHEGEIIADGPVEDYAKLYRMWAHKNALNDEAGADRIIRKLKESYERPFIEYYADADEIPVALMERNRVHERRDSGLFT